MTDDLPHLTFSPTPATPHPHTPERGGGVAVAWPHPASPCHTSGWKVWQQLEQKLMAEAPGILQWMIKGCLDWQAHRRIGS
jgi:hypothetical protein